MCLDSRPGILYEKHGRKSNAVLPVLDRAQRVQCAKTSLSTLPSGKWHIPLCRPTMVEVNLSMLGHGWGLPALLRQRLQPSHVCTATHWHSQCIGCLHWHLELQDVQWIHNILHLHLQSPILQDMVPTRVCNLDKGSRSLGVRKRHTGQSTSCKV